MRIVLFLLLLTTSFAFGQDNFPKPQRSSIETKEPVIPKDIPLTNSIRRT